MRSMMPYSVIKRKLDSRLKMKTISTLQRTRRLRTPPMGLRSRRHMAVRCAAEHRLSVMPQGPQMQSLPTTTTSLKNDVAYQLLCLSERKRSLAMRRLLRRNQSRPALYTIQENGQSLEDCV